MFVNAMEDFSWMVMERLVQVNSVCEHPSTTVIWELYWKNGRESCFNWEEIIAFKLTNINIFHRPYDTCIWTWKEKR